MSRKACSVLLGLFAAAVLCAQDSPPDTPQQAPAGGGGFGGRGGVNAAAIPDPQPYDRVITKDAKTTKGLFTVHQIKETVLLRDSQERTGQGLPLEFADRQDDPRRGLWRRTVGGQGDPLGTEGQPRSAAGGRLQPGGRPQVAHRHGGEGRQQRRHHHVFPRGGIRQGRRAGDRGDAGCSPAISRSSARASAWAPPPWMPPARSSSTSRRIPTTWRRKSP